MHRSSKPRLRGTALVGTLAGLVLILGASVPRAQGIGSDLPVPFDPPETAYFNGGQATDPVVERTLSIADRFRAFLPAKVDLASHMPAVGNQGNSASCTAWATAYAARSYYTQRLEGRDVHQSTNIPSPKYVYHLAREGACDDGTNIERVAQVLRNGALSLAEYPFTADCAAPAPPALVARARDFRVRGLRRIDFTRIDNVKGQLAQSNPVIIRLHDSEAFHRHRGDGTFAELPSDAAVKFNGWHALTAFGYDDSRQALHIMNSWGLGWGDRGLAWISYDVVRTRVSHAYVLDVSPPPRPPVPAQPPVLAQPPKKDQPAPLPQPVFVQPQSVPPHATPAMPVAPAPSPGPGARLAELQNLACARVSVQAQGNRSKLTGFVGSDADLNLVKSIAAGVPNTSLGDIVVAPWPQCEALQTLEKPLAAIDPPRINIGPTDQLRDGDTLRIEVQPPSQISYLYIAYMQADGSVVNLAQPKGLVPQPTLPGRPLVFGDGQDGRAKFTIKRPFGREMIIAIASRSPLFDDGEAAAWQTEREYLTALRRALIYKPSADMPDRDVAATIKMLQTREGRP
jgi:hypothetical protein